MSFRQGAHQRDGDATDRTPEQLKVASRNHVVRQEHTDT